MIFVGTIKIRQPVKIFYEWPQPVLNDLAIIFEPYPFNVIKVLTTFYCLQEIKQDLFPFSDTDHIRIFKRLLWLSRSMYPAPYHGSVHITLDFTSDLDGSIKIVGHERNPNQV